MAFRTATRCNRVREVALAPATPAAASECATAGGTAAAAVLAAVGGTVAAAAPATAGGGNPTLIQAAHFAYSELRSAPYPAGVDANARETSLTDAEFLTVFGMGKEQFSALPKWKQTAQKKKMMLSFHYYYCVPVFFFCVVVAAAAAAAVHCHLQVSFQILV